MLKYLVPILSLISNQYSFASEAYCVAIRGNGQNVAAHWSALSRIVEENGMPEGGSAGSSGTISLFFLDNIAGTTLVSQSVTPLFKQKAQALMLRSLPEFLKFMISDSEIPAIWQMIGELKNSQSNISQKVDSALRAGGSIEAAKVLRAFDKYQGIVNPELIAALPKNPYFFKNEILTGISLLGNFDAVNDKNLFIRPGIADFKGMAIVLGIMADFYAGNSDAEIQEQAADFFTKCTEQGYRKEWSNLPKSCRESFDSVVKKYLNQGSFAHTALFEPVGKNFRALPTTSVVTGPAVKRFTKLQARYLSGDESKASEYQNYSLSFDKEIKFGYWGKNADINSIRNNLAKLKTDLKSQKFLGLGETNWFEVLATSPAEPGLASIQKIPANPTREQVLENTGASLFKWKNINYRPDILSAGGWSDLHPMAVLKASGCKTVVYVTRKGGETIFGQQVFIRLTGLNKTSKFLSANWENIAKNNDLGWEVSGTDAENSPWAKLYNYKPESSYMYALRLADAVYCTDWNKFEPFKGETDAMVNESFTSPVFVNNAAVKMEFANKTESATKIPGCLVR